MDVNIWPEALILGGAAVLAFLLPGVLAALGAHAERLRIMLAVAVGVAVAMLFYAAGLVDAQGLTTVQGLARAVIAGILMAMAAKEAPSTLRSLRRGQ